MGCPGWCRCWCWRRGPRVRRWKATMRYTPPRTAPRPARRRGGTTAFAFRPLAVGFWSAQEPVASRAYSRRAPPRGARLAGRPPEARPPAYAAGTFDDRERGAGGLLLPGGAAGRARPHLRVPAAGPGRDRERAPPLLRALGDDPPGGERAAGAAGGARLQRELAVLAVHPVPGLAGLRAVPVDDHRGAGRRARGLPAAAG